ncbi:hypothetical protein M758_5G028200 [Ceratodon purpureus]|nr:hypothetical protein M758_5G028200 [Ceratodon purpureus]
MGKEDASNAVLLVISQVGCDESGAGRLTMVVDGREMGSEEWRSLVAEAENFDVISVRVDRERLLEHSTYFRSLENFSEFNRERLNVNWDPPIFCILLQCMHGFQSSFSSCVIARLIQAADYFGVDEAITRCKNWVDSEMCNVRCGTEDDFLSDLLSIWSTATEIGEKYVGELCVKSLAINFARAMVKESFITLPLSLLEASIDHPKLTIKSEMDLCNALLLWYENQELSSSKTAALENPIHLFKKIQLDLLPFDFIIRRLLWKYPLNSFYTSSATPIESDYAFSISLINLWGEFASKPVKDYLDFKPIIRLTEYLKELDFSFCHQITCHHLIAAAAKVATIPMSTSRKALLTIEHEVWPDLPEFINMEKLNLSYCWRVEHKSLQLWLKLVCPNLLELRAQNCGHPLQMVLEIGPRLPNLLVLDLSEPEELMDIVGAVTRTKSKCSNSRFQASGQYVYDYIIWDPRKQYVENRLRELSLRGRSEMTDDYLLRIARNCPSLQAVDLSGCSELSDAGVAAFLNVYNHSGGLRKLSAAGTRFGPVSCKAFESQAGSSNELHRHLEILDLGGCSGLGSENLSCLLQALPLLTSLGLAFTKLDDMALSAFLGTSLRHLNLRETKVSGGVLSRILARNSNMKDLNIRGCTQLAVHPFDFSLVQNTFEWVNVEAGWGLSDSTFSSFGFSSWKLRSLAVGVGGSISGHTLLCISEKCPELKRLSLCFQVISDEDLLRAIRKLKSLHSLELQNMSHSSGNLLREIASSLPDLKTLKLERVVPLLSDDDLILFSRSSTGLQSLSLLGCQQLTNVWLETVEHAWDGIRDLRLEDCQHLLTEDGSWRLLISLPMLEVLHLRHIGKMLPDNFIAEATRKRKEMSRLNTVYINRCKSIKDAFHSGTPFTKTSSYYKGRTHKDTIVLEWNSVRLKESVVSERLTFE